MGIESNKEAYQMMMNALGSIENRFREAYNKGYKDGLRDGASQVTAKLVSKILEEVDEERSEQMDIREAITRVRTEVCEFIYDCTECISDRCPYYVLLNTAYNVVNSEQTDCPWK